MSISTSTGVQFSSGQDFFDHILTDWYLPVIADARNNSAILWELVPKVTEKVGGRFITFPVRNKRSNAVNTVRRTHGAGRPKLPDAGRQGAETYAFMPRSLYARVLVDGESMDAARLDAGTYLDLIDTELDGIIDDIIQQQNRMLHNDGSGRIAEVSSASGSPATIVLQLNSDLEGNATCDSEPTKFIEEIGADTGAIFGARIAIIDEADHTLAAAGVVETITPPDTITVTLTFYGSKTIGDITSGDWVVLCSNDDSDLNIVSTGYRTEPMGVAGIYSDAGVLDGHGAASGQTGTEDYTTDSLTNFQGISATANNFNQAVVKDNSGAKRPISDALLQETLSDIEERNNGIVDVLLSSFPTYNDYVKTLIPDKRFMTTELKGGHKVLDFNGLGFVKDRFTFKNRVYFLGLESGGCRIYEVSPLKYLDFDGRKWLRLPDEDAFQLAMCARYNMGVDVRERSGGVLVDLDN